MIDYFNEHIYSFWFVVGFILLALEAVAFGFSTGFVLFIGLAALTTGGLMWSEIVPLTWLSSIATFTICSVLVSVVLWKPLKSLQSNDKVPERDNTSDIVGLKFRLTNDISISHPGTTRYSGIEWKVEIDPSSSTQQISAGTMVTVMAVDVGKFWVAVMEENITPEYEG